jgi:ubiquinone/menaquinone biosynthesis C-methylase UbiE
MSDGVALQREYYRDTVNQYDGMHVGETDEHAYALRLLASWFPVLGVQSVLDVGAGTGRAQLELARFAPSVKVFGIEPIFDMVQLGQRRRPDMARTVVCGDGVTLPFGDRRFDCVTEFGVLHHVPRPDHVVAEMMRVARCAVVLSDENRYGMRGFPGNLFQLAVFKAGLWRPFYKVWTRGKGYQYCKEDGVRYSFSVYDCHAQLAEWADQIWAIPIGSGKPSSLLHPLMTASHVLLCAFRNPDPSKGAVKLPGHHGG